MPPSLRRRLAPCIGPSCDDLSVRVLRLALDFSSSALVSCQHQINKYHAPIGDPVASIARTILADLEAGLGLDCRYPAGVLYSLGLAVDEVKWPGRAGPALTVLFLRWAEHLERGMGVEVDAKAGGVLDATAGGALDAKVGGVLDAKAWVDAAATGLKCLEVTGWEGEMLVHGLKPMIGGLVEDVGGGMDWLEAMERAARVAEAGARHTAQFHGGVADSGCHALGVAVRAVYQAAKLERGAKISTPVSQCRDGTDASLEENVDGSSAEEIMYSGTKDGESSEPKAKVLVCGYEGKDLESKDEESESKVSAPISIRSSKSDNFLEGTRNDDIEESDSLLIHSEVSDFEANDEEKRYTDKSDSVLIHSEISDLESPDGSKHDSGIEVTDSSIIHPEKSRPESKPQRSDFSSKYPRKRLSLYPALGEPALKRPSLTNYVPTNSQTLVFPTPRKPLSFYM